MKRSSMLNRFICVLVASLFAHSCWAIDFGEVSDEDRSISKSQIEEGAHAEYLYRGTFIDDRVASGVRRIRNHHKIKVFTANGVKQLSVHNLTFDRSESELISFRAKVTHPDGSVDELNQSDLFDRTIFKSESGDRNYQAFSPPRLRAGSIVEYEWIKDYARVTSNDDYELFLQATFPTRVLEFSIKPLLSTGRVITTFNYELELENRGDGEEFYVKAENIVADFDEAYSLSDYDYKPWLYFDYNYAARNLEPKGYWELIAGVLYDLGKNYIRPSQSRVKKLARRLFEDADSSEAKLEAAYNYCAEAIRNKFSVRSGFTEKDLEDLKFIESPAETIRYGYGSELDINALFASLAINAGFEAKLAYLENRQAMRFNAKVLSRGRCLPASAVAVRRGGDDKWRFFMPGQEYIPYGRVGPGSNGAIALLAGDDVANFVLAQSGAQLENVAKREAYLKLSAEGGIEGYVRHSYTGYAAYWRRVEYDSLSPAERQKAFLDLMQKDYPNAEISDFEMRNVFEREAPLEVSYNVRVPGFAETLGKRLFFAPSFFRIGDEPMFAQENRKSDIVFYYPWIETDLVEIDLPGGYRLEETSSPGAPFQTDLISYEATIGGSSQGSKLSYTRKMSANAAKVPVASYESLKRIAMEISKQDSHSVTLVAE